MNKLNKNSIETPEKSGQLDIYFRKQVNVEKHLYELRLKSLQKMQRLFEGNPQNQEEKRVVELFKQGFRVAIDKDHMSGKVTKLDNAGIPRETHLLKQRTELSQVPELLGLSEKDDALVIVRTLQEMGEHEGGMKQGSEIVD